eukprot:GHVT01044460.1.p1 GENE.GHVT01044460.1~~GHVT01044460.1.p1  ORF type:complete len:153 (-),score=26.42 GHVT01044460.1:1641-2099(-)
MMDMEGTKLFCYDMAVRRGNDSGATPKASDDSAGAGPRLNLGVKNPAPIPSTHSDKNIGQPMDISRSKKNDKATRDSLPTSIKLLAAVSFAATLGILWRNASIFDKTKVLKPRDPHPTAKGSRQTRLSNLQEDEADPHCAAKFDCKTKSNKD